ncbi:cytochrome B561 [Stenotrophomonas ginsengisoli]|uniref:Cytochrome B561 n=1 Tax=Stenotrophomonas ginsengisoli TaxID=336566 RepID=A0A0R0D0L1_9GAMM|nr:cytochrome b [Stenotrophomonas ginsengisoli]KRG75741.1 cytochrome B561 [Stenotrophomonas ginsengisoli]
MSLRNTAQRWGAVSQLLHWGIVALIAWMAWLGLTMVDMPPTPAKINTYALHKSVGLTLLVLVVVRLAWRLYAGAPRAVPGTPTWQARIASLTHVALYVLLLGIPLSGWLFNSAAGYPLQWFKQFNLPALAGKDEGLAELAISIHEWGFWALLALVALHASAALYHHLFQGDDTLRRMLPGYRPQP